MLPAAAQGVVGIECLADQTELVAILGELQDPTSELTTAAERAVAARLDANCQSPVASYAIVEGDQMTVTALVASEDGRQVIRDSIVGNANEAEDLGTSIAERLLASGAGELLAGSSG